jgi:hypothetical protein
MGSSKAVTVPLPLNSHIAFDNIEKPFISSGYLARGAVRSREKWVKDRR